jgi:hypothetical protein
MADKNQKTKKTAAKKSGGITNPSIALDDELQARFNLIRDDMVKECKWARPNGADVLRHLIISESDQLGFDQDKSKVSNSE